jgi:hypothetical protein
MNKKCYMVYTKSVIGHKVYATSNEDAIRAYNYGEEVDDYELESEIQDVIEEE